MTTQKRLSVSALNSLDSSVATARLRTVAHRPLSLPLPLSIPPSSSPCSTQAEEDKMVMAGAFADPVDGALFIFKNVPREEIDAYVQSDPYVVNGLVTGWKIKPWTVVVP